MKHLIRVLTAGAAAMVTAACGQKGALYLPDHDGSVVTRPAGAPATGPQPAPQETPQGATPQEPTKKKPQDKDDGSPPTDTQPPK